MAKLLASERRKAQHAAWVSGMEVRRSNDHLGRVTGLMVAGALATGLFSWAMVKRDYATAPVIMTSLSAVLTTAAAVKFGKLIYTRRAITREIQAASR
jgi:CBS domain containing-hemolysin-like protein